MESAERLQSHIGSLTELRTIVRTMKALSAASIRQYELAVHALAEYYRTVERGLYVVLQDFEEPPFPRHRKTEPLRLAAIIFGSDYGLCGRINEDITAYALERIASSPATADGRLLLAVGARIAANLEQLGQSVEEIFLVPGSAARITATVQQILLKVDEWRQTVGIHYVYLFYNRPVSAGGYRPTGVELLPVNLRRFHRLEERTWPSRCLPTYRMERQNLLAALLRQYFFVSIFRACAESQASEHTSRLTAMQTAEKNLDERLAEVTGEYRRVRQDAITAELLDVVSGFEALTSGELSAQ